MAGTFISVFLPYVNKYVIGAADSALSPMYIVLMCMLLLGSGLAAYVSAKIGNRNTLNLATLLLAGAALSFYATSFSPVTLLVSLAAWGVGMGLYIVALQSSLIDESKGEGARAGLTGLLLGLLFAGGKIGDTLGGVVTGALLSAAGTGDALYSDAAAGFIRAGLAAAPTLLVVGGYSLVLVLGRRTRSRSPVYRDQNDGGI